MVQVFSGGWKEVEGAAGKLSEYLWYRKYNLKLEGLREY